jgi:hypothetical protein
MEVQLHAFLLSTIDGDERTASFLTALPRGKSPEYSFDGILDCLSADMVTLENNKFPASSWESNPGRSTRRVPIY